MNVLPQLERDLVDAHARVVGASQPCVGMRGWCAARAGLGPARRARAPRPAGGRSRLFVPSRRCWQLGLCLLWWRRSSCWRMPGTLRA